ncbi:nitrous oxidase accessory protein [Spirosomataceae bacterium TFI 002]|nr:nitrous oxidase accessory protein [Spirosomataceae bacterium TFI 002]
MKTLIYTLVLLPALLCAKEVKVKTADELKKAVATAKQGDHIIIAKGHYNILNLEINTPITISGEGYPVLDADFKGEILIINADDVTIKGIQFQNVGQSSIQDWAAIKILQASNVKILNNKVYNTYFGIYLSDSESCIVKSNVLIGEPKNEQNTGNGVHAWKCDKLLIENNYVKKHRDGYYFEFVTNSQANNNYSYQNTRYGLHFMFSHKNSYQRNHFEQNGAGVAVMYSNDVSMRNNEFKDNWGGAAYGLLLKDIKDSDISNNSFSSNTVGILMESCNRLTLNNNRLSKNGIAIRLQSNCEDNVLTANNFFGNTFDMGTSGNMIANTINANYWDKYEGYDLDKNGQGDVPFRPVSLFSTLIDRMPQAMMLLRSFTATLLDKIEKVMPSFTPENLLDETPLTKPVQIQFDLLPITTHHV